MSLQTFICAPAGVIGVAASSTSKALGEMADSFMALAREEAEAGYATKDPRRVRDAAEKAWLAVLQATDASMERHGRSPDAGPGAHDARQDFLEAVGRGDLATQLRAFADLLHGRYFYRGAVPEAERMRAALDDAAEFIRRVLQEI